MPLDWSQERILVIAPHADDEILEAGGTMARAASGGAEQRVLFATIAGYRSLAKDSVSSTESRRQEAQEALDVVGVTDFDVLFEGEEHHLKLDRVPQLDLISWITGHCMDFQPTLVLTPCLGHYHQDHRAVATAAVAALRPGAAQARAEVAKVLAYGHALEGWGGRGFEFNPSVFVDIGAFMEKKLEAFARYGSQACDPPHPRSPEYLKSQAQAWGNRAGVAFAEPFECLRWLV